MSYTFENRTFATYGEAKAAYDRRIAEWHEEWALERRREGDTLLFGLTVLAGAFFVLWFGATFGNVAFGFAIRWLWKSASAAW